MPRAGDPEWIELWRDRAYEFWRNTAKLASEGGFGLWLVALPTLFVMQWLSMYLKFFF